MRRRTALFALGILAYVTGTLYLIPFAARLLPHEPEPQTASAAIAELTHAPVESPLELLIEPEDGISLLTEAISNAATSLDLVIYELQDESVERALLEATKRGVSVRVLLENLNSFGRRPNQAAFDFFTANGVPVRWAPSYFPLVHQKTLVVDRAQAYIMTFNLQPQYYASSRDFAIIDQDPYDISAIESAFDSDWNGKEAAASSARDLVWSPGSRVMLESLIAQASTTLDIYNEEMADPDITRALEDAASRGVLVRIVMTYATNWKGALNELSERGAEVRTYASSAPFYIHAKAIIADGSAAFVGSENFSSQSLDQNRELGIVMRRPDIIASLEATFNKDWEGARPYSVRK